MYTYNKKNLTFSLVISSILLFSGCGPSDNNTKSENNIRTENPKKIFVKQESKLSEEKIAELEAELEADITGSTKSNRLMKANSNYQQPANLLSVKIVDNIIKLYFDELELADNLILEDFTAPLYDKGYTLAIENKIENPEVELYFDGKNLSDMLAKSNQEMRDVFPRKKSNKLQKSSQKLVILNLGHGIVRTANNNGWGYERPLMSGGYREDLATAEMGMILASKLNAEGIQYKAVRELNKNAGKGYTGYQKWQESARRYFIAHSYPSSIWNSKSKYTNTLGTFEHRDIRSRPLFANYKQADVLISIHSNASSKTSVRGTRIYIAKSKNPQADTRLTNILKKHLNTQIHTQYPNWSVNGPYKINHAENAYANMPSVIIELGFHTNTQDRAALSSNQFRNLAMEAIKNSVKEFLNIQSSPSIRGEFDGAGSLVCPTEDKWGCNKDMSVMHPHQGTGSTVVFQWVKNSNTCNKVKLTSSQPIKVAIKSKAWDKESPEEAFTVDLGSNPISLNSSSSPWSTFAVTSMTSPTSNIQITAECQSSSESFYQGNRQSINKDLVLVHSPYFWVGTGSIISSSNSTGYGSDKDDAITSNQVNAVTSFQWDNATCKKLKLTNGTTNDYAAAQVSIKGWDEANDNFQTECTSLPCEIEKNNNGYYILQIKSNKNAVSKGYIEADCI